MNTFPTKTRLLAVIIVTGLSSWARADLCWPADPFNPCWGFTGGSWIWDPTYQAVQATPTSGGYTLGEGAPTFEYSCFVQTNIQVIANCGCGRLSFDVSVHDTSFLTGNWTDGSWYQIHYAGNSDGVVGWTQDGAGFASGTYVASGPNDHTWHFDLSFAQMGWHPGDTWFQIFWAGNSDIDKPLHFYIDNVCVHVIPPLAIKTDGHNLVLSWTNASYTLQSAPEAIGVYTNVPGATSPYTNPIAGPQQYFRLKR